MKATRPDLQGSNSGFQRRRSLNHVRINIACSTSFTEASVSRIQDVGKHINTLIFLRGVKAPRTLELSTIEMEEWIKI